MLSLFAIFVDFFVNYIYNILFIAAIVIAFAIGIIIGIQFIIGTVDDKAKVKETREEQRRNHILYKNIEDTFQGFFGSKVKLDAGKRRGKIIIEYTSNDDLERILGLIK